MKRVLLFVFLLFTVPKSFSQQVDAAAAHRIGDYGKLWAVLDLFHPEMAYGKINRDSLFVDNIGDLLNDPSAANFKAAVQKMLTRLDDPYTTIQGEAKKKEDSVFLEPRPLLRWLPDSIAVLYFNADAMRQTSPAFVQQLFDSIRPARGLVIDLRKTNASDDEMTWYYEPEFMTQLIGYLTNTPINAPAFRTRIHYGHESQTFDMSSFYYQGWFLRNGATIPVKPNALHKPVCLLVNRFNGNVGPGLAALQNTGLATVVGDGVLKNMDPALTHEMKLADSVRVAVRLSEVLYGDGSKTFLPDVQLMRDSATTSDTVLDTAVFLLRSAYKHEAAPAARLQNLFSPFPVAGYDSLSYPAAALRLLGLMRYWTAINYFCPNKDRITKNWDSVLYEYVPRFLAARDSFEYHRTAARLIKEINDGHGWFGSRIFQSFQFVPPVQLRYIAGKTIVQAVFDDSLKNKIAPGDELLLVNNVPVKTVRDSLAQYIGASNDAALQRDVSIRLLAGRENTIVTITVLHNGRPVELALPRRANMYEVAYRPVQKTEVWKKLTAKLGYVDLGRLEVAQIDSMFTAFKNTDAIILDDRSYPRGTVWTLVNYLTDQTVKTALGTTMIAESPDPSTSTTKNEVWEIPVTPKWKYTGKLIILVNETTQSQAEYSCMVLQAASKNVTIIGSQTAGADGDVTGIKLPGGITTAFSGHGIHYPDGRPTQGIGIVPNIKIKPTIAGIKAGRDEVLERAVQFAKTGK